MVAAKSVRLVYAITFLDLLAVGLIFPLLYPHVRSLGTSHFLVGLLGSTYSALQVISGPIIGSWSDLRGRKFVLLVTLGLSGIAYFCLALVSSITLVFALRIILGVVKHTQTLSKAVIADILPKEEHAKVYGTSSALGSLGFVVGPIIGGHLSELDYGFSYACVLTGVAFLINAGLVYQLPASKVSPVKTRDTQEGSSRFLFELKKSVLDLTEINWSYLWDAFLLRFLFALSTSIFFHNQSLYLKENYDLSQLYIGYSISFLSIVGSLSAFFFGAITKTFYSNDTDYLTRLFHFFTLYSISFLGLYFSPNFLTFVIVLIPFAVSNSLLRVLSMELMLNRSSNETRGLISGASNSVMSVARFVSPVMTGVVADSFGLGFTIALASVPSFIGVLFCSDIIKMGTLTRREKTQ